jgi:hypothetical protein
VREGEPADGDGLEGAELDPAVRPVAGAVQDRDVGPWQADAAVQQAGLVGLDGQQVVGLLAGDGELGGGGVGVQHVGGDHGADQLQSGQQRLEGGDLARGAVDPALGEDDAGGVVHRGQQVGLPPSAARRAPRRVLPSTATARRRWSGWSRSASHAPIAAASASGSTRARVRRIVVSVGTARTQRPVRGSRRVPSAARTGWGASAAHSAIAAIDRARQDRGSGEHQDGDQWMPAPGAGPGVGDGGEVGQQVGSLGWSERISVAQDVQAWRDQG